MCFQTSWAGPTLAALRGAHEACSTQIKEMLRRTPPTIQRLCCLACNGLGDHCSCSNEAEESREETNQGEGGARAEEMSRAVVDLARTLVMCELGDIFHHNFSQLLLDARRQTGKDGAQVGSLDRTGSVTETDDRECLRLIGLSHALLSQRGDGKSLIAPKMPIFLPVTPA